ncbi:MAG: hypothetical protein QOI63_262 [Thermoplasmata archaeon]|jgi:hypothetical protein|nr:hypothetical protein [Thermoplasmata archaeon]
MQPPALPKASLLVLAVAALAVAALPAAAAVQASATVAAAPQGPGCNVVYFDGEGVTIHPDCLVDPILDDVFAIVDFVCSHGVIHC